MKMIKIKKSNGRNRTTRPEKHLNAWREGKLQIPVNIRK